MDPFGEQVLESLDLRGVDVSERRVASFFERYHDSHKLATTNNLYDILLKLMNQSLGYQIQLHAFSNNPRYINFLDEREYILYWFITLFRRDQQVDGGKVWWPTLLESNSLQPITKEALKSSHVQTKLIAIHKTEKRLVPDINASYLENFIKKVQGESDFSRSFWEVMKTFNKMITEYNHGNGEAWHAMSFVTNSRADILRRHENRVTRQDHPRNLGRHPWNHRANA